MERKNQNEAKNKFIEVAKHHSNSVNIKPKMMSFEPNNHLNTLETSPTKSINKNKLLINKSSKQSKSDNKSRENEKS